MLHVSVCLASTTCCLSSVMFNQYTPWDNIDGPFLPQVETASDCYLVARGLLSYDDDGFLAVDLSTSQPLEASKHAANVLRSPRCVQQPGGIIKCLCVCVWLCSCVSFDLGVLRKYCNHLSVLVYTPTHFKRFPVAGQAPCLSLAGPKGKAYYQSHHNILCS